MPPTDPNIYNRDAELLKGSEEPDTSNDIDFSKPAPRDVNVPIGGAMITVPRGGLWWEGSEDRPDGSVLRYSVIDRGESRIVIDPATLEITELRVDPQHQAAFDRIVHQLEAQR
jgi:hypothetical protein